MNIISLCVVLVHLAIGVLGDRPWFLHSSAVSAALNTPTYTVLHSTGNSTHFFLLDQFFSIHYFRLASGSVVYDKTVDNQDGAGVSGGNWRDTRTSVDVKIGLNPYNSQLYMVKYGDPGSSLRLMLYRYNSANARTYLSYFEYFSYPTFSTTYAHPRVKMAFDSTHFYVAHYNDPTRASKGGYFIARLTHTFGSQTTLTSSTVGVLSIDFNCHQSPYICMWLTNQTVVEYSMSTLSKYRTYSSVIALNTLRFNPQIVETSDGSFTYYLHHTTINGINAMVQKKKANHDAVSNESAQLPYDLSNPPPEAFDLAISSSGQIIAGMTTTPSPSIGIGNRDIAVFRYSSTLQLESQFLLSTTQQDNVSSIFSPNGDGNTVVVCGTTDGAINSPTSTSTSRRAFVARFNYFSISSVSTNTPNIVLSGETVNVTFSTLPPSATTGTPLVTFNLQACTSVKWTASILSATIPPGSGGPYELLVQFNYLPHNPSVSMNTLSYMLNPVILGVWPRQGPAVGYDITITGDSLFPQNQLVTAFIGGKMCISVLRVNLTAISCRTPPGTGRNVSVVLSNGGINNSTQNFQIAYDPPVLTTITPTAVPTDGATVTIKGFNFGPCSASPCTFVNMTLNVGGNSCNGGLHFNDSTIQCVVPQGYTGSSLIFLVTVNGQSSVNSLSITYAKPIITAINPRDVVSKNPSLFIDGSNFGPIAAPRTVVLHSMTYGQNYSCPNVTWISHANIRCDYTTVELPLYEKFNVTVNVGNLTSDLTSTATFGTGVTNNPPVALPISKSTFEEQSLIIQFEFSDPNPDDTVKLYINTNPTNGTLYQVGSAGDRGAIIDTVSGPVLVSNAQVSVLYVPYENFNGYDGFTFKARDSWGADSSVQNASITVIAVPDPPVPKSLIYTLDEDTEALIQLEIEDPDTPLPDRVALLISLPQQGSLQARIDESWEEVTEVPRMLYLNTLLRYSPNLNYYGTDSFMYLANDGNLDSMINATITLNINSVNDPPYLSTTNLNFDVYEDTDIIINFDISDVDIGDKLTVKITEIQLNGSLYMAGLLKEPRNLLGEGSELRGPPYQVLYSPAKDFFTSTPEDMQNFKITYSDISSNEIFFYQVSFAVLPMNDPPFIPCAAPFIALPPTFVIGQSRYHSFQIYATDVDDSNLTLVLKSAPSKGILRDSTDSLVGKGSELSIGKFIFETNRTGGGYPYSNFTVIALDSEGSMSNECTFIFTFTCPPGLYNNIFKKNRGEICEPCPTGAVCSTDGSVAPRAKLGWWKSDDNMTFLECFPKMACVGTAENTCAEGYEGIRCASCGKNFYRLGEACRECKVANYVPTIIAVSVIFAVVLLLTLLRHFGLYKLSFASMHILINFLQTIWILRNIRLDWPQELLELVEHINFIALNIDIVAPECIVQEPLTFSQRLRIVLALPLCLLAITLLIASIAGCIKKLRTPRTNNRNRNSFLNTSSQPEERDNYTDIAFRVVGLFHVALSIVYVNIAAKSFALFDCTVEDDGNAWLDAKVSLICYQDWWYQDLPYGIAAIIVYALAIPLYFSVLSYFYYQTYHEGRFWDKWRQISGRLMERFGGRQFKPEYRYFVVLQLFEKLAMVAVSTFFTRYTGLQIVLTIIILLSLLITYMKYNPYEHPTLNILEKMSVVCSISVLAFGLPFKIDSFRSSQYRSALIAAIMSLIAGFILAVLGAGLNDIRRNIKANREK